MTMIADIRKKYPQYDDMSDQQLADAFHRKFYSDMPVDQFNSKIGLTSQPADKPAQEKGVLGNLADTAGTFLLGAADTVPFLDEAGSAVDAAIDAYGPTFLGARGGNYSDAYDQRLKENRATRDQAYDAHPVAGTLGTVAGALAIPGGVAGKTLGKAAAIGAGEGALYGFGAGEGGVENRLTNAAIGGTVGGLVGGVANRLGAKLAPKIDETAIRSADDLSKAASESYKTVLKNADKVSPTQIDDLAQKATANFDDTFKLDDGVYQASPNQVRKTVKNLNKISDNGNGLDPSKLHDLSKSLGGSITHATSQTEKAQILGMKGVIDDTLKSVVPELDDAKGIFRQSKQVERVNAAIAEAKRLSEEATNVNGKAIGKTVQSEFAKLSKEISAGKNKTFTPEQVASIKDIAGTKSFWGDRIKDAGALINPFTLKGAISNPVNVIDAATGFATGGMSNLATFPLRVAVGHGLYKAGDKLSEKALKKAKLLDLMMRAGVNKVEDLPKTQIGKAKSLLSALTDKSPYVTAVSASDLLRNDKEQ